MRNKLIILGTFLISMIGWCQLRDSNYEPILTLGYTQGTHSIFQFGMEYDLINNNDQWLFIGAGAMTTKYMDKQYWMPYLDVTHSGGVAFYGVKASTKHIQPQLGISLLNMVDLGVGYAIPFNEGKLPVIKGFNFNLRIRITGNEDVYPKLKIGF